VTHLHRPRLEGNKESQELTNTGTVFKHTEEDEHWAVHGGGSEWYRERNNEYSHTGCNR
jgi:hypothetical protein